MRAVVTRVRSAKVEIDGRSICEIGNGLLVLLAVAQGDEQADIDYIVEKTLNLRIFEDAEEKMNLSLKDVGAQLLLVSNFTLMGDCRKGRRPSFIGAGSPSEALPIYDRAVDAFKNSYPDVKTGQFQADMQVFSCNDGPVTLILDSKKIL